MGLWFWGAFFVYGTLFPFEFQRSRLFRQEGDASVVDLSALIASLSASWSWGDVVANLLLLAPWGGLLAARMRLRGAGAARTFAAVVFSSAALSGGAELAQMFTPHHVPSLIDLACNVAGAFVGALAAWASAGVWERGADLARRLPAERPFATAALAVGLGLFLSGLTPFLPSLDVDDLKLALKHSRPVPFGPAWGGPAPPVSPWSRGRELFTWASAGAVFALAAREGRRSRGASVLLSTAAAAGLSSSIELCQLVFAGHTADATTAAFASTGALAGSFAVVVVPSLPARELATYALAVWAVLAVLATWTLSDPAADRYLARAFTDPDFDPGPAWRLTLDRNPFDAVDHRLMITWAYVPLGALLSLRRDRNPLWLDLLIVVSAAYLIESLHQMLADVPAELLDVASAFAGAALGALAVRWAQALSVREPTDTGP
ncbi:MAG: VanZ family protein [Isosphaeraceae bacterium]